MRRDLDDASRAKVEVFLQWFAKCGGYMYSDLCYAIDEKMGLSIYCKEGLPANASPIHVSRDCCITASSAYEKIMKLFGARSVDKPALTGKEWIVFFLFLHKIISTSNDFEEVMMNGVDRQAKRLKSVEIGERIELLEKLNSALSPIFLGQLRNLHKMILNSFKSSILEKLKGDNYDFGQLVSTERKKAIEAFIAACALICLADTDWSTDDEIVHFKEGIDQIADQCRAEETKKMVTQIERSFKKEIAEPTEIALSRPGEDMWDRILTTFREALQKAEATYTRKAKGFNCTEEENEAALSALRRKAWLALRAKIDEQTADAVLLSKLRNVFEDRFRYDEEGVPRVWKPSDDIDGFFRVARDETLKLIPIYSKIEPTDPEKAVVLPSTSEDPHQAALVEKGEEEEFDFPSTLTLFTETRKGEITSRFRKEADAYYVEAKRSTVSSIAQVPMWMYGVMVALGWNEFLAVVRSPLYFTFLLLCLAGAYIVWRLNLAGPLASVSKAVGREVHRIADEQLRQHFQQPLPQPAILVDHPAQAKASSASAIPKQSLERLDVNGSTGGKGEEIELKEIKEG